MSSATPAKRTTAAKKTVAAATTPAAPAKVVAPVAAPAPVAVAAPAAAVAAAPAEEVNVVKDFNSLVEKVNSLRTVLGAVLSDMKKLEKQIPRELKKASKGRRRRAAAVTEGGEPVVKKESVFTKPTPISDALCTFLGVAKGSLLSRSEVTTKVCGYAKSHQLMDKQVIKADAPLRKLLALTEKDELKILNLQRYLKPHYLKPAVPAVAATKA
jgi:chromatin remodeling complex protein RSC6